MRILVTGASGFIGRRVATALAAAGHEVLGGVRRPRDATEIQVDFARDVDPEAWLPRLRGIEAVVNAVGIFEQRGPNTFEALHDRAPRALFAACQAAGVRRVVQISALGADAEASSRFHATKKRADEFLATLDLDWVILQPSIVFGPGGASARLFAMLASLPVVPLPGRGDQRIQPVHVDDVAALVVSVLANFQWARARIPAVGPRALTVREWLAMLRVQLGLGPAHFVSTPLGFARLAQGAEAIDMLERGNVASAEAITRALSRPPRDPGVFIEQDAARCFRLRARLDWTTAVLRAAVAITWIAAGVVSLGLYPEAESRALLARVGLTGALATVALYGAALLDIALGVAVYAMKARKWLWRAQIGVMLVYTAILTLYIPELWLHPFGPVVKNIPLLGALVLLHELEEDS